MNRVIGQQKEKHNKMRHSAAVCIFAISALVCHAAGQQQPILVGGSPNLFPQQPQQSNFPPVGFNPNLNNIDPFRRPISFGGDLNTNLIFEEP